jgi:hypothetical protein
MEGAEKRSKAIRARAELGGSNLELRNSGTEEVF